MQSGYTTAQELVVLEDLIPSPSCAKVDYLLVLFGANDATLPNCPSGQHVPIEKFRENLKKIITHPSIAAHSPTILLVTPPPLNEVALQVDDASKGYPNPTRRQIVTAQYAQVVRDIAKEFNDKDVVLIDFWDAMMKVGASLTPGFVEGGALLGTSGLKESEGLHQLLKDALHPTDAGYKVLLDIVTPHVGKGWAQEPFDNPSWIFP